MVPPGQIMTLSGPLTTVSGTAATQSVHGSSRSIRGPTPAFPTPHCPEWMVRRPRTLSAWVAVASVRRDGTDCAGQTGTLCASGRIGMRANSEDAKGAGEAVTGAGDTMTALLSGVGWAAQGFSRATPRTMAATSTTTEAPRCVE